MRLQRLQTGNSRVKARSQAFKSSLRNLPSHLPIDYASNTYPQETQVKVFTLEAIKEDKWKFPGDQGQNGVCSHAYLGEVVIEN